MIPLLATSIGIAAGFGIGILFFWLLKINSELYLQGEKIWLGVLTHLARFATLVFVFWYISSFGAVALLGSFGGFLMGRLVFMKYMLREE